MKRLLLCLAILSLMALPAMAQVATVGIDVQGYVDGTASYQSGCVDQYSCEVGVKEVCDVSTAGEMTKFDCAAHVPSVNCGVDVDQCSWDSSITFTQSCSVFSEQVDAKFAVGSADMNSLGGVAICATNVPYLDASASVYNSHAIENFASVGSLCSGCWATASYTGSQSLDLQADYRR